MQLRGGASPSEILPESIKEDDSDDYYQGYPIARGEEFEVVSPPVVSPISSNGFSTTSSDHDTISQVYEYFGLPSDIPSWDVERAILLAKKKFEDSRKDIRRATRNEDFRRPRVPPRRDLQRILNLAESVGLYDPQAEATRLRDERVKRLAVRLEKENTERVREAARQEHLASILSRPQDPQEEGSDVNDVGVQLPALAYDPNTVLPSTESDDMDTEMQDAIAEADITNITNSFQNNLSEEAALLPFQIEDIEMEDEVSAWSDSDSDEDEDLQPTRPESALGQREAMLFTQRAPVREDPSSISLVLARSSLREEVFVREPSPEPDVMEDLVDEWF